MKKLLSLALTVSLIAAGTARAEDWIPVQNYAAKQQRGETITSPVVKESYFSITMQDVERKVAEAMVEESLAEQVEANVMPSGTPVLYKADHPIELVINSLQVNPDAKRWQAQAYVIANGKTETVKPISGRYDELVSVPMLTRQIGSKDVIEMTDLELRTVPSRKLRKDTITDVDQLIGKSARRMISADRMVRSPEVVDAITVEKDRQVEMVYSTPNMSIRTMGKALENGATGELIRVMNNDTQRTVSARIIDGSRVEVNPTTITAVN